MGGMCSSGPTENDQGKGKDAQVQRELNKSRDEDRNIKKLLFLGPGNSGKSTFFKQLLQIHGEGFTEKHIFDATKSIYDCVILQMKNVIHQAEQFKYQLPEEVQQSASFISQLPRDSEVTQYIANQISLLWMDENIKDAFHNRSNLGIVDSADYFFNEIDRISKQDYTPNEQDILLVRTPTTGVIEETFFIKTHKFRIFDVGGQRSERSKWIHCFDTVTAVLFVASLSCYDQGLFEMEHVNAMHEALLLFDEIINSRWFRRTAMILFLNKQDLFRTKIQEKDLKICFPDYDGDNTFQDAVSFITKQFTSRNENKQTRQIYTHVTCATNRSNVQKVFNDVQHIIVQRSLNKGGLL